MFGLLLQDYYHILYQNNISMNIFSLDTNRKRIPHDKAKERLFVSTNKATLRNGPIKKSRKIDCFKSELLALLKMWLFYLKHYQNIKIITSKSLGKLLFIQKQPIKLHTTQGLKKILNVSISC